MTTEERKQQYLAFVKKYAPICDTLRFYEWLCSAGFFDAPASTKYHGAYPGGLFDHSLAVFDRLDWMTKRLGLEWTRNESPFIVGMYHDLCKCDQYKKTIVGIPPDCHDAYEYNTETLLKGHGEKSIMLLSQLMTLTEEEVLCIRYHMGAYNQDEWQEFDKAIRKYPNVLVTHTADMFASKVDET